MTYQQIACVEVVEQGHEGLTELVVWVEAHRVNAGDVVTFKETGDRRWAVEGVFPTTVEGFNRGWGLDLPKSQRTER